MGAGILAIRHAQDRGRDGGLVQAARSAPVLLRDLQHRARQHEPGGRAQLRLRRRARPARQTVGGRQGGDRARLVARAPSALGLEHEHDRDDPARLRHGGHRALHLFGRRPARHGADLSARRPRAGWADRREPRGGESGVDERCGVAGRAPSHRGHLRRARLVRALCRPDARRQRRPLRHDLQGLRPGLARRRDRRRDADRIHVRLARRRKPVERPRRQGRRRRERGQQGAASPSGPAAGFFAPSRPPRLCRRRCSTMAAKPRKLQAKPPQLARARSASLSDPSKGGNAKWCKSLRSRSTQRRRPADHRGDPRRQSPARASLSMPGAVKIDCDMELVVNRASVEQRLGRAWDPQEIHLVLDLDGGKPRRGRRRSSPSAGSTKQTTGGWT